MGVYLSKAKTTKESDDGGSLDEHCTRFGVTAMQGWRQSMEDAHIALPMVEAVKGKLPNDISLYGVFDGHGGPTVSEWIARHFSEVLAQSVDIAKKEITEKSVRLTSGHDLPNDVAVVCEALQRTFLQLDCDMQTKESREEIQEIYEHLQQKQKDSESEPDQDNNGFPYRSIFQNQPKTLLQALLGGSSGRPMIRIVEQDGERFFQISPPEDDDEDEEAEGTQNESRIEEVEANTDNVSKEVTVAEEADQQQAPTPTLAPTAAPEATVNVANEIPQDVPMQPTPQTTSDNIPDKAKEGEGKSEKAPGVTAESMHDMMDVQGGEDNDLMDPTVNSFGSKAQMPSWGPENCGAAAIVAALISGEAPYLVTANAGDSRCVLCRKGEAVSMSEDHKPGLVVENNRIVKAGGTVIGGRVDGNLNLSRTIGDLFYKNNKDLRAEEQKITAFPDVRIIPITQNDEFVILACDGIWDCVTNQEAVDFVKQRLGDNPDDAKLSKICEELCDHCLAENPMDSEGGIGCDNMTCIVVLLNEKVRHRASSNAEVALYESSRTVAAPKSTTTDVGSEQQASTVVGDKAIDVSAQ
eukprot:Gregarina_sp_Poly_1__5694@NODE_2_length_28028_cov_167_134223_g1_i0_p4_GENE_NODE_2_length_28028_cov_167_134223_g1_i0NODE_2_length_28028_cov_167_134223_g1_i0_p4_ORF_typecomplete_len581_score92_41PP2C/PF00481_21/7_5e09PP2C/PF00481_21/3_1e50PP2C_2/PF13672_6/1_2PP2C_2/PF13672_6/1e09SpoIIE/PF07228_12/2_8e07RPC_C/PF11800_8/1_6RPC_C/PF11800_8/2_3e03_NODE_2_length_28028_cov_167_134223_g1_i01924220984